MKAAVGSPFSYDWREFFSLGEELLNQGTTGEQCRLIIQTIEERFSARAQIWLMDSFFPLPGETEVNLYRENAVPAVVKQAVEKRTIFPPFIGGELMGEGAALPLAAQNNLLGVIYVEPKEKRLFSRDEYSSLEGLAAHAGTAMDNLRQVAIKHWRYEQLALVRQVSMQIGNIDDLDELCRRVTRLIQSTFNYYHVVIFTLEEKQEQLCFRANASMVETPQKHPSYQVKVGEAMIGYVAQTGKELLANDVRHEPRYEVVVTLPETQSELCLPIKVDQTILGVLDVQSDRLNAFHDTDLLVLRALADNIAMAMDGIYMYSSLKAKAEEMAVIYEFSRALNSILDPDELLKTLTSLIHERFGFPHVYVFTVHSGRRRIMFGTGSGSRSSAYREHDLQYDLDSPQGMISWVARNGKTVLANDVSREPLYRPSDLPPDNTLSELTIPLIFGENVLGVLDIQSDRLNAFSEGDVSRFEALAASIAISMRNALLYRSEKWRLQVAENMRDVAVLVSANIAVVDLLETILNKLEQTLPCDASAVWLVDPPDEADETHLHHLYLAAVRGVDAGKVTRAQSGSPDVNSSLEKGLHANTPAIRREGEAYDPLGKALGLPQDYSSIIAPMNSGGHPLGVIVLAHRTPHRYGEETSVITGTFASYASVAIQNARLYEEAQDEARKANVLLQVAEAVRSVETEQQLLDTLVQITPALVGIKQCGFLIWDEGSRVFIVKALFGIDNLPIGQEFIAQSVYALDELRLKRAPVLTQEPIEALMISAHDPSEVRMVAMIPVLVRGNLLGAFLATYTPARKPLPKDLFEEDTLVILQGIVHQAALALENIRLEVAQQQEAYVTAVLLQVAQAVVSQNELVNIMETIVHLLPIVVGIDTALIYLWKKVEKIYQPVQAFAGSQEKEASLLSQSFSSGSFRLLDEIRDSNQVFSCLLEDCSDALSDWIKLDCTAGIHPEKRSKSDCRTWLLGFPLSVKGEVLGVLLIKESATNTVPHEKRLEILQGVAQQLALAIQNENYNLGVVERERTEREFQLARQIQKSFLPDRLPEVHGWELGAYWEPARQVGGDLYDIFPLGDDRLGLVIADVSDKGLPAALYMTVTHALIRAHSQEYINPAPVLERINAFLLSESQDSMFVTAVYAILDLNTGLLRFANAGHNRPLLVKGGNGGVTALAKGGMALGVVEDYHLQEHELILKKGDYLLFYTDGITETFSPTEEEFGEERLTRVLRTMNSKPVADVLARVEEELAAFRGETSPSDDVTMLGLRRL